MNMQANKESFRYSEDQNMHLTPYTHSHETPDVYIQHFDFAAPAALTLRAAGNMAGDSVDAIKRRANIFRQYCRNTNYWPQNYILPQQVHKRRVHVLNSRNASKVFRATDGLISRSTLYSIAIRVADCLPIYIAVPTHGIIGLLHSGRRSTGILSHALAMLRHRFRVPRSYIHVLFGPAIGACCYKVGEKIAKAYQRHWGADTVAKRNDTYYLNLVRANERIATKAGISHLSIIEQCTCCNNQYHSHRRSSISNTDRMLALISPIRS